MGGCIEKSEFYFWKGVVDLTWIKEKRKELQRIIDNINGCYTTNNKTGFSLNSKNGVVWAQTSRGKKWGQAFEGDGRFYVAIDFPEGCLN